MNAEIDVIVKQLALEMKNNHLKRVHADFSAVAALAGVKITIADVRIRVANLCRALATHKGQVSQKSITFCQSCTCSPYLEFCILLCAYIPVTLRRPSIPRLAVTHHNSGKRVAARVATYLYC